MFSPPRLKLTDAEGVVTIVFTHPLFLQLYACFDALNVQKICKNKECRHYMYRYIL